MKTKNAVFEMVAGDIVARAERWNEGGKKSSKGDKKMLECYRNDRKDLKAVARLVARGKLREARDAAAELDTIVRDELPDTFFTVLKTNGVQW
jgi:hypothetical protein